MATVKYTHDDDAFGEHVLRGAFMVGEMRRRADAGKAFAEVDAPFDPKTIQHYKDSFHSDAKPDGGVSGDRAEGYVWSDDPMARHIEYGNGHEDTAHSTLTRALGVMGQ